jgi:hypothetical protein
MLRYLRILTFLALCLSGPALSQTSTSAKTATNSQILAKIDAVAEYLQDRLADDVYDLEGVALSLGPDPNDLAKFVKADIAYRPYWGALKGEHGVLLDRVGNALDQSLLLAGLMERQNLNVRIAIARLDAGDASRVLALGEMAVPVPPTTLELDAELLSVLLNQGGVEREELKRIASEVPAKAAAERAELAKRGQQFLSEIAHEISPDSEFMTPPSRDSEMLEKAKEYAWVEYQDAKGTWQIAEPLDLEIARKHAASATYFDAGEVPDALLHTIEVSAAIVLDDGARVPLGGVNLASDLAMIAPLHIANRPAQELPPENLSEAMGIVVESPEKMRFTIEINGQRLVDTAYTAIGTVLSGQGVQKAGEQSLSGIGESLKDIGKTAPHEDDTENLAKVTSIELSYVISSSKGFGKAPLVREFKRTVIPHDQHAGAGYHDIGFRAPWSARLWVIPFDVDAAYFDHRSLQAYLGKVRSIVALLEGRSAELTKRSVNMDSHASPAHRVALLARAMATHKRGGNAPFSDQMTVVVEETGVFPGASGLDVTTSLDLVQIAGATLPGTPPDNGLLWTIAEVIALEQTGMGEASGFLNSFHSLARSGGTTIARVEFPGEADGYAPNLRDSLNMEIAAGRDSLVLSHYGDGVYLTRDKDTGLVVGRLPGGRGNASETGIGQANSVAQIRAYKQYADALEITLQLADFVVCTTTMNPRVDQVLQLYRCALLAASGFAGMANTNAALVVALVQSFDCFLTSQRGGNAKCLAALGGSLVAAKFGIAGGTPAIAGSSFASGTKAAIMLYDIGGIPRIRDAINSQSEQAQ